MSDKGSLPVVEGSVLVARGDSALYEAYEGLADRVASTPVNKRTRFQIASVSKQMTATAALLLFDDQRLSLGTTIDGWFSGCPRSWEAITVHHLLSHTSGLGHWPDYRWVTETSWEHSDELVEAFYRTPLRTRPGASWYYSSPGYVLLARIVEQVARMPYVDFVHERILGPLGMADSSVGNPAPTDEVAQGYDGAAAVPSPDLSVLSMGAGDVWSTVRDLLRFDHALAEGTILSAESRSLMFSPHARTRPGSEESYGYAWALSSIAGHAARYHTGENPGFRAVNAWLPDRRVLAIVLSNQQHTDPMDVANRLVGALATDRPRQV